MNIKKDLVRFNESALPNSFVAIAVELDDAKVPCHAGILIRLNDVNYLHHYCGAPQLLNSFDPSKWFVYKIINIVKVDDENEIGAFLMHCKRVCENSEITYSCVFDGSAYNAEGKFESLSGLPELGTCVGFCLNTLAIYFIDRESYLQIDDWDESSIPENFPLDNFGQRQTFARHPNIDRGLYNAFRKRISPLDYLCAAFIDIYPIARQQIDEISQEVLSVIAEKF